MSRIKTGTNYSVIFQRATVAIVMALAPLQYSWASRQPAAIGRAILAITAPSPIFYGENGKSLSPMLIANFNQISAEEKPFDISKVVPIDLAPTNDGQQVLSRMADHTVNNIFQSPEIRNSEMGRTATSVEKVMNQDVFVTQTGSVKHRLNLNVQAFQSLASLNYSGLTNLSVHYRASERKVGVEMAENIGINKQLVVSHEVNPLERLSGLNMRWNF